MSSESLIPQLEQLSRQRPDRLLRLQGQRAATGSGASELFELLIYRGFSSSTTHPTDVDPDRPVLPEDLQLVAAELLAAPLDPSHERVLVGPCAVDTFLDPAAWD